MSGDPHSQLVPTSPIWSQLDPTSTKKSGSQLPRSWCIQNPRELQLLLLPTFQNYDVVLAMVGANTRAQTSKTAPWFVQFMAILSVDWWCVAHIIQLDKAKAWTCSYCVSSLRNRKCSKPLGFCDILVECTVCNKTWSPTKPHPDVETTCHK